MRLGKLWDDFYLIYDFYVNINGYWHNPSTKNLSVVTGIGKTY